MRNFILTIALGLLPASLHAQETVSGSALTEQVSPEQDLDCAIFVALAGANAEGTRQSGVIASMTYFIGRFEAATGADFSSAAAERLRLAALEEIVAQSGICMSRMEAFSVRLDKFGEAFKGLQGELNSTEQMDD